MRRLFSIALFSACLAAALSMSMPRADAQSDATKVTAQQSTELANRCLSAIAQEKVLLGRFKVLTLPGTGDFTDPSHGVLNSDELQMYQQLRKLGIIDFEKVSGAGAQIAAASIVITAPGVPQSALAGNAHPYLLIDEGTFKVRNILKNVVKEVGVQTYLFIAGVGEWNRTPIGQVLRGTVSRQERVVFHLLFQQGISPDGKLSWQFLEWAYGRLNSQFNPRTFNAVMSGVQTVPIISCD